MVAAPQPVCKKLLLENQRFACFCHDYGYFVCGTAGIPCHEHHHGFAMIGPYIKPRQGYALVWRMQHAPCGQPAPANLPETARPYRDARPCGRLGQGFVPKR